MRGWIVDTQGDFTLSLRHVSIFCATAAVLGQSILVLPATQAVEPTPTAGFTTAATMEPISLARPTGLDWTFKVWNAAVAQSAAQNTPAAAPPAPPRPPAQLVRVSPNPNAQGRQKKQFATFQPGECSFPGVKNPSSCDRAQRWAINQVNNPSQGWSYLCLSFVTHAYGRSSGAPTASAMWNDLSRKRKHPGDISAPPGALMFWGPNHVAISLGNRMLISTDILGSGKASVVSYATMQSVWNLDYLGWAEPEF